MEQRRKIFNVKFRIVYPSGKYWSSIKKIHAISEFGAAEVVRWLHSNRNIEILEIKWSGEYVGSPIIPSHQVLGDF